MLKKLNKPFIFLFFLLLPVGWAKHWLTSYSLVNGVLVDYLMPDLWLQDILAIITIIANLQFTICNLRKNILKIFPIASLPACLLACGGLLFTVHYSLFTVPLRFFFMLGVAKILLNSKKLRKPAVLGLAGAVIWTGLLAILQTINQGTVLGWWFLGEPIFSLGSYGVKKIILFGYKLVLPMATFPHANVMGAFGLLSFFVLSVGTADLRFLRIVKFFSLILIILSGSLPVYFLFIGQLLFTIASNSCPISSRLKKFILILFLLVTSYGLLVTNDLSFYRRWELIKAGWLMFKDNWLFGVGWGNFVKELPNYWNQQGIKFLQPVHNVFLLILAELGVIGTGCLVFILHKIFRDFSFSAYRLLITYYLLLLLIDHYFWTTTQGVYMLSLLFLV